jgi:uncharacterized protein with PIN domain
MEMRWNTLNIFKTMIEDYKTCPECQTSVEALLCDIIRLVTEASRVGKVPFIGTT